MELDPYAELDPTHKLRYTLLGVTYISSFLVSGVIFGCSSSRHFRFVHECQPV